MKIIVGLGNPGKNYHLSRHNLGFMFLDYFGGKNSFSEFKYESKFRADIAEGKLGGEKVLLVKPQTFMNLSGEAVVAVKNFYKLEPIDILVIFDDMSMDFGKVRYRASGSAGGHNGIKDIIRILGNEFPRLKVGVGYDERQNFSKWVLSEFEAEELIDLENEVWEKIEEKLEEII